LDWGRNPRGTTDRGHCTRAKDIGVCHARAVVVEPLGWRLHARKSSLLADGCKGSSGASEKSIFDLPPQREPAMTLDERQKMQKEPALGSKLTLVSLLPNTEKN
jgi:hypothetical protein